MASLDPSAVFSPSLARQQRLAAKDWTYIDSWLSAKFSPSPVPPFERNPETLRILLNLAAHNEAVDEERNLLADVERQALKEAEQDRETREHDEVLLILQDLEEALTDEGHASLVALAQASNALGVQHNKYTDEEATIALGRQLVELQHSQHAAAQAQERVDALRASLERETARIADIIHELEVETKDEARAVELGSTAAESLRQTKLLRDKLPDLKSAVALLQRQRLERGGDQMPTIGSVKEKEDKFRELLLKVKAIEAQVAQYHGLPPDIELARAEVERARGELDKLTRQRDNTFEGLVERESPKKRR